MQETLSDTNEQPAYELGMTEEERRIFIGPDPTDMTFDAFAAEYKAAMYRAAETEKDGSLDPYADNYRPMTDDDRLLIAQNWKAFSDSRGYTKEQIDKYERWLELSGQKQEIPGAKNDPWRRSEQSPAIHAARTYVKLLQQRIDQGERPLSPEVVQSKEKAETLLRDSEMPFDEPSVPEQPPTLPDDNEINNSEDVW